MFGRSPIEPPLSRAAGQQGHVLAETECRELHPLHRGEIGEQRLSKVFDREAMLDCQHRRLNAVASFRREDMRSEKQAGLCLGYQLDQSAGVTRCQSPRHLVECYRHRFGIIACMSRFGLGQADTRHLGIGEHYLRHGSRIIAPAVAFKRILGRQFGTVGCHVDVFIPARDIAGGIDPGARCPQMLIDHDGPALIHGNFGHFQIKTGCVGGAARCDQNLFGIQFVGLAIGKDAQGNTLLGLPDAGVCQTASDLDSFPPAPH